MRYLPSALLLGLATLDLGLASTPQVDPLPAPQNVKWGNTGPIQFSQPVLSANAPNSSHPNVDIVTSAWDEVLSIILELKWVPYATQAAFPTFDPFPTASATASPNAAAAPAKRDAAAAAADPQGLVNAIYVDVEDWDADLQYGVDECYTLEISASNNTITVTAPTTWGVLHAFTTLLQLVISDDKGGLIIEQPVLIEDWPDYPWRGILIDMSRNYISVNKIKEQIDAMRIAKLNTVHFHLTDAQSWPFQLESFPNFTQDAYSPAQIYTHDDIKGIIQYARAHGVRVIPEIDMPGHARAGWQTEDIVVCQNSWWDNDGWTFHTSVEPPPGQVDPLNNKTYDVVQKVYTEMSTLFTDNFFHLGLDEVQTNCWNYSSLVLGWLAEDPSRTWSDVVQHWLDKIMPMALDPKNSGNENRRIVLWDDSVLSPDAPARNISKDHVFIQSWNNRDNIAELTKRGYKTLISSSDFFYADCGLSGYISNDDRLNVQENPDPTGATASFNYGGLGGSWCGPTKSWERMYDFDITLNLTAAQIELVVGGEMPLFGEMVDDANIAQQLWPRAGAVAELFWSGNQRADGSKRTTDATQRMYNFRELLVRLGIPASPIGPRFCSLYPHWCDLFANQTVSW